MAHTPKPIRRRVKPFKLAVEKLHRDHKRKHGKGSMLILDEIGMISDRDMRNAREQMRLSIQEAAHSETCSGTADLINTTVKH